MSFCPSRRRLLKQNTINWVAYKQQKLISPSSGGAGCEIKVLTWSGSGEGLLWVTDCRLVLVSSHGREQSRRNTLSLTLTRALILFMRAPLLLLHLILIRWRLMPLKCPTSYYNIEGRISYKLGKAGDANAQSITLFTSFDSCRDKW